MPPKIAAIFAKSATNFSCKWKMINTKRSDLLITIFCKKTHTFAYFWLRISLDFHRIHDNRAFDDTHCTVHEENEYWRSANVNTQTTPTPALTEIRKVENKTEKFSTEYEKLVKPTPIAPQTPTTEWQETPLTAMIVSQKGSGGWTYSPPLNRPSLNLHTLEKTSKSTCACELIHTHTNYTKMLVTQQLLWRHGAPAAVINENERLQGLEASRSSYSLFCIPLCRISGTENRSFPQSFSLTKFVQIL